MQRLPAQLLVQIFQYTESNAVCEKSCVSLAMTCKAFRDAFADSGRQESCKKAALQRLLRWSPKVQPLYKSSQVRLNITATLDKRKTQRLIEWLGSGLISMDNFWEAQDLHMAVRKEHEHAQIKFLALVLVFPKERVLDMKAKEDLQDWMVDFCTACPDRLERGPSLSFQWRERQRENLQCWRTVGNVISICLKPVSTWVHLVSPLVGEPKSNSQACFFFARAHLPSSFTSRVQQTNQLQDTFCQNSNFQPTLIQIQHVPDMLCYAFCST